MTSFNAVAEFNLSLTPKRSEHWLDRLADYHPAGGHSDRQLAEIVITFDAISIDVAAAQALRLVRDAVGTDPERIQVMHTAVFDELVERDTDRTDSELLSVTEAAHHLGLSRQRILQLITSDALPAIKIGRTYSLSADTVSSWAERMHAVRQAQDSEAK